MSIGGFPSGVKDEAQKFFDSFERRPLTKSRFQLVTGVNHISGFLHVLYVPLLKKKPVYCEIRIRKKNLAFGGLLTTRLGWIYFSVSSIENRRSIRVLAFLPRVSEEIVTYIYYRYLSSNFNGNRFYD